MKIDSTMTGDATALADTWGLLAGNESSDPQENRTLLFIEWDDWDVGLWTPEQRQRIEAGIIPREVYIAFGVLLTLIVVFGIVANATILYVFAK